MTDILKRRVLPLCFLALCFPACTTQPDPEFFIEIRALSFEKIGLSRLRETAFSEEVILALDKRISTHVHSNLSLASNLKISESGSNSFRVDLKSSSPADVALVLTWIEVVNEGQSALREDQLRANELVPTLTDQFEASQRVLTALQSSRPGIASSESWTALRHEAQQALQEDRLEFETVLSCIESALPYEPKDFDAVTFMELVRSAIVAEPKREEPPPNPGNNRSPNNPRRLSAEEEREIRSLEARLDKFTESNFGDAHPTVVSIRQRIAALRRPPHTSSENLEVNPFDAVRSENLESCTERLLEFIDRRIADAKYVEDEFALQWGTQEKQTRQLESQLEEQIDVLESAQKPFTLELKKKLDFPFDESELADYLRLKRKIGFDD